MENKFLSLVNEAKSVTKNIEEKTEKIYLLEDESEIFRIVDMYLAAVDTGEERILGK